MLNVFLVVVLRIYLLLCESNQAEWYSFSNNSPSIVVSYVILHNMDYLRSFDSYLLIYWPEISNKTERAHVVQIIINLQPQVDSFRVLFDCFSCLKHRNDPAFFISKAVSTAQHSQLDSSKNQNKHFFQTYLKQLLGRHISPPTAFSKPKIIFRLRVLTILAPISCKVTGKLDCWFYKSFHHRLKNIYWPLSTVMPLQHSCPSL